MPFGGKATRDASQAGVRSGHGVVTGARALKYHVRMKRMAALAVTAGLAAGLGAWSGGDVRAQNRMTFPLVDARSGHVALGLALRRLNVSATFMQTAAHPDDEHNALYALFTRGMGLRSIDVQTTRGGGGQNEIGPELFRDIAVLRTSELLAAHRIDGAEQYFTRAIDYGYSFDPQEVIAKWGRDAIVGDFVRLIRTFRPDVLLTMNIQGRGGDRAHEATTVLTREAYFAAGDPSKYPEQIKEGLRPWRPAKLYFSAFGRGPEPAGQKLVHVDTAICDPLLDQTYADIGGDAHSFHKCQGMSSLLPLPGFGRGRSFAYQLVDSSIPGEMAKGETSLFDGVDTRLTAIARFAGPTPPAALVDGLEAISKQAQLAQLAFDSGNDGGAAAPIEAGLEALRALRVRLDSMSLSDPARYEVDFRLKNKERDYEDAVLAAHNLVFDAVADDGLVIDGQPVKLSLLMVNRGGSGARISGVDVGGFDRPTACATADVAATTTYTCSVEAQVPGDAALTTPYFTDRYWNHPANPAIDEFAPGVPFGVAFRRSPFRVTFHVHAGTVDVSRELPIEFRYVKDLFNGDKRMELAVVPAMSVSVTPPLAVVPAQASAVPPTDGNGLQRGSAGLTRELHVTVTNGTKGPATATVRLQVPAGWTVAPASAPISFTHEDESLSARFEVTVPPTTPVGRYPIRAAATEGDATFDDGYQAIEYPHVQRRQVIKPAEVTVEVVNVKTVPGIRVGYIVGVGDQVPPALEQLGARVSFIDRDELAWGDLSKYDVIMTGVRAYERRDDLRAYNQRLLNYAERGGTVIVQYNKFEFNRAQYGPYPAKVTTDRVADETAPVKVLQPDNSIFNVPNRIGPATWDGWVQERGLYFLGEKDPRYVDLVSMVDSFPDNPGVKLGSLVEATLGKGHWIYLGLGLWRQLPAGTDGAYQLLANLVSVGQAGVSRKGHF
jgi:LmbE family N-acetylglucosaminyl deacetylase